MPKESHRQPGKDRHEPHYQVNWLLLIATALVAAVVIPAAHFWHRRQLERNGSAFLVRADALEEDGKWTEAAEYLYRYNRLFPEGEQTDQTRIRLAETYDRGAKSRWEKSRAAELYSTAIGLAPEDAKLRQRQAELQFELSRYGAALAQAEELLKLDPGDPLALRLRAQSTYALSRGRPDANPAVVKNYYELAIKGQSESPSTQVLLSLQLAHICRDDLVGRQSQGASSYVKFADDLVDQTVREHPDSVDAWVGRYDYRRKYGLPGAEDDLNRAWELDKDHKNVRVCLCVGDRARNARQFDMAAEHFEQAIAAAPEDHRGYLGLGASYAQQREFDKAIEAFTRGLKKVREYDAFKLRLTLGETLLNTGRLREAGELLDALDRQVATMIARGPRPEADRHRSAALSLRGRWHMARSELALAEASYKQALALKTGLTDTDRDRVAGRGEVYLQLGSCYVAMRKWDQAAVAFNEAATLAPNALEPKLAAARAWQAAGRLDEAIRLYAQGTTIHSSVDTAWVGLAEVRLRQQVGLAAEDREWKEFDDVLQAGLKAYPNSLPLKMLEAEADDLRGASGQTLEMLEKTYASAPGSFVLAERLMLAYEDAQRGADAERTVREVEDRVKDGKNAAAGILLRSTLLWRRGQLDEAEKLLRAGLTTVPSERQADLKLRLAALALRTNRAEEGRRALAEMAESPAAQPRLVPLLAELALEARDLKDLERWEAKLLALEGEEGSLWRYFRAQRLITAAKNTNDPGYKEAQRLAADIVRQRPSWGAGYVLKGHIAQRLGDSAGAIEAYKLAVDRGARQSFVFEQLTALLYQSNRMAEADQYLKRLGNSVDRSSELAGLAIPVHLRQGNKDRAVAIARQNAQSRPNEPAAQVWLGQTLLVADKKVEAQAAFRRAVELGPSDAPAWQGLFSFYARTGQKAEARETLVRMIDAVKVPEKKRAFILAQGYEALGDRELARAQYQKAVAAVDADPETPADPAVFERAAAFFAGENPAQAVIYQRSFLEHSPNSDLARRGLVSLLIARGDDKSLDEAAALVEKNSINTQLDPQDQRLKATLFLRRGGSAGRGEARRLLEDLAAREVALPNDRLLLAGILEGDGQIRGASEQMFVVASREDAPPNHLVAYIEMLLREERAAEVEPWVDRLIKAAPNSYQTVSVRTRWMAATQRRDEARPLIAAYLERRLAETSKDTEIAQAHLAAGRLYEQAGLDVEAERSYRDLARLTPNGYIPLANWLAVHQRVGEAVSLCVEKASADSSTQPAVALAHALIVGNASRDEMARAEPVLAQAIASHADSPELVFSVATLRLLGGQRDEAISLFRKVLALDPKNALARNNLASLLAERPENMSEALQMIDEAIAMGGRSVELLDTKGMILLRSGKLPDAIKLLREATMRPTADARHLFHLSLAYHKAGKFEEARTTLALARERSLNVALLSPDERQLLTQLQRDLGV